MVDFLYFLATFALAAWFFGLFDKKEFKLVRVNITPTYLYRVGLLQKLAGITTNKRNYNDWTEDDKKKWNKFMKYSGEKNSLWDRLRYQLNFLSDNAVIVKQTYDDKADIYIVPFYGSSRNEPINSVELGKTKDGKTVTFHLMRRTIKYRVLPFINYHTVLTGYLRQEAYKTENVTVLFDFPEVLLSIDTSFVSWKNNHIKNSLLKKLKLKDTTHSSGVYKDDLGEYKMWTDHSYENEYFEFSQIT